MANELTKAESNALSVSYDVGGVSVVLDIPFVKQYLVRGSANLVSDQEFMFFMNMCKAQKLNPLNGQDCFLIKYGERDPAQMVVGKGAYLRRMFEHPDYLCKEDGITVQRGNQIIQKEGCCLYPGENLIGGWCRVHYMRNGKERTAFKEVSLAEYNRGMANWKSKPSLMVNKVAVSQCAREAFPKDYEGLYSEEEMVASGAIPVDYEEVQTETKTVDLDTEIVNQEQKQKFLAAIQEKFSTADERNGAYRQILAELNLTTMNNMTVGNWKVAMERVNTLYDEYICKDQPAEEAVDVPEATEVTE